MMLTARFHSADKPVNLEVKSSDAIPLLHQTFIDINSGDGCIKSE